jgi:hypothetical protein
MLRGLGEVRRFRSIVSKLDRDRDLVRYSIIVRYPHLANCRTKHQVCHPVPIFNEYFHPYFRRSP